MTIYFDNAATSHPKPVSVISAVTDALTDSNANPGRSGHTAAIRAGQIVLDTREKLARLLGEEDPTRIVFTMNCTDSLNLAIKGSLFLNDHVITTQLEHNSVLRPLSELAKSNRIELTILPPRPDGFIDPDDVKNAIRANTRLIVMTQSSNVTGAIQPVAAVGRIAREYGVRYLVDGAQALGSLPVNTKSLGCDLYAFPGHKSLLGPQGTGGLFIRSDIQLRPLREGGTGSSSDSLLQPTELPERYESGTVNLPGIAGLGAAVSYVAPRISEIMSHERELTSALFEGLLSVPGTSIYSPREEASRTGIISFNLGDLSSSQAADALSAKGIAVRGGLHCAPEAHRFLGTLHRGVVRASLGYANTFDEVDRFLKAVREVSVES